MRVTNYSDSELRTKIKYLFSVATDWRNEAATYLKERRDGREYGGEDEKYFTMKAEAGRLFGEAYDLINSGQIPWMVHDGLGNNCDVSGRTTTVVARRVFDTFMHARVFNTFMHENDLSKFDGRAIELTVRVAGKLGSTEHSLTFRDPETVKKVIEQLQQELNGWDDWDGGHNEI